MLFTLLFDANQQLVAAAPTCDQSLLGDRYWTMIYPQKIDPSELETAIIHVQDRELIDLLQLLPLDSDLQPRCHELVEESIFTDDHGKTLRRSKAA